MRAADLFKHKRKHVSIMFGHPSRALRAPPDSRLQNVVALGREALADWLSFLGPVHSLDEASQLKEEEISVPP